MDSEQNYIAPEKGGDASKAKDPHEELCQLPSNSYPEVFGIR